MNKRLMFHVEHQFNLLKVQLINKYEFKNQITMLIILLKTTLMKNINHIINISIIKLWIFMFHVKHKSNKKAIETNNDYYII